MMMLPLFHFSTLYSSPQLSHDISFLSSQFIFFPNWLDKLLPGPEEQETLYIPDRQFNAWPATGAWIEENTARETVPDPVRCQDQDQ